MKHLKLLCHILIIFTIIHLYRSKHIIGSATGNLREAWEVKVKVFAKELLGLVLYSTDSKNRLMVRAVAGDLMVVFNEWSAYVSLNNLCGCSQCWNVTIDLSIYHNGTNTRFVSNCRKQFMERILSLGRPYDHWDNFPIRNVTNTTFFWHGNIEEHMSSKNIKKYRPKDILEGCLYEFCFNDQSILFNQTGEKFLLKCEEMCLCHKCRFEKYLHSKDQEFADHTIYGNVSGDSLQVESSDKFIELKVSWQHLDNKDYCFAELIQQPKIILIEVKGNELVVDDERWIPLTNGTYCIALNFSRNTIDIMNGRTSIKKEVSGVNIVNIGFSSLNKCPNFSGIFGLGYNGSEIKTIRRLSFVQKSIELLQRGKMYLLAVILVFSVGLVALLVFNKIHISIHYRKNKVTLRNNHDRTEFMESEAYLTPCAKENEEMIYDFLEYVAENEMHYSTITDINFPYVNQSRL